MTDRLLVLAGLAVALLAGWLLLRWRTARYRRPGAADLVRAAGRRPLVLAFSTPECVPCRTQQRPALDELQRRYPGRLSVRHVDAVAELELAERFGIMTVPSTVVVDPRGRILAINHGVASWEKLAGQLALNGAAPRTPVRATEAI
ncbi:MAG TPA: thioredoxin family protein [bacterium]|nr:thioredoxin family protein [bacterium]